jgi:hypothetical protein
MGSTRTSFVLYFVDIGRQILRTAPRRASQPENIKLETDFQVQDHLYHDVS